MTPASENVKQWIDLGKDPRSAHWQGALAAIMNIFLPDLEPGRLIPVKPLTDDEFSVFLKAVEIADLSPNLAAAFLPPAIAGSIVPPESAEELIRIDADKPSFKLLILRSAKKDGTPERILCAEISEHAHKPGVEIFQDGALLGTYDYQNQEDCLAALNKVVRAHVWEKDKWPPDDVMRYTLNWFEKVLHLREKNICVDIDHSFFHSPTLIRGDKTDAAFELIARTIEKQLADPEDPLNAHIQTIRTTASPETVDKQLHDLIDSAIFECLNVMTEMELMDFKNMTDREAERFNRESRGTLQRLVRQIRKA